LARPHPLGTPVDIVSSAEGVDVHHLAPSTTLLVWTLNTLYRVVIVQSLDVSVQGGALFPESTAARLVGASFHPGGWLKVGWIGIGLRMELRLASRYVVTSPVRAITHLRCA
jgi:hypothetical protein